jgi:hypothetical protein
MLKRKIAEWLLAFIIFAFAMFLAGGLIRALNCHGLGSAEAAGWMQAIGVIAAIVGAYAFGEKQAKIAKQNALELEERQKAEKLHGILAIMDACENAINELLDTYNNNPSGRLALALSYDERVYDGFVRAITSINLHDIKSPEGITAMIGAQQSIARIQVDIKEFLSQSVDAGVSVYGGAGPEAQALQIGSRKEAFRKQHKTLVIALQNI